MPVIILCVLRFVRLLFSGHYTVAVENVALPVQQATFNRKRKKAQSLLAGCSLEARKLKG